LGCVLQVQGGQVAAVRLYPMVLQRAMHDACRLR
jgi:hypothetical protein